MSPTQKLECTKVELLFALPGQLRDNGLRTVSCIRSSIGGNAAGKLRVQLAGVEGVWPPG